MAVEYDPNGTPILTNDSLISDVPPYTQALAATGVGGGGGSCTVKDSKFNDLQPADPISPFPIGMLAPFMGENAPDGWLLCDGRTYDAAYFYALAEANPDFHGDGTFRVPDMRGRHPVGAHNIGAQATPLLLNKPLGGRVGDERIPQHAHELYTYTSTNGPHMIANTGSGPSMWPFVSGPVHDPLDDTLSPVARNQSPATVVNFIVYTGKPTLDENGDILAECGQGEPIAAVTTRMMLEARLAEAGIGEEEIKMLKEQLEEIKKTEAK